MWPAWRTATTWTLYIVPFGSILLLVIGAYR